MESRRANRKREGDRPITKIRIIRTKKSMMLTPLVLLTKTGTFIEALQRTDSQKRRRTISRL